MSYLLVITNLYCNHQCSYCIQQESSLDVRLNPNRVDVPAVLKFLHRNRISRSVKVMGGESTVHPDFEMLMDGLLRLYRKIVFTTNINGKWYRDFSKALETMKRWGHSIKWNTTYHPNWMDVQLYIDRVKSMRKAGVWVDQVATPDTPQLTPEIAAKLFRADIGWQVQPFTGRDDSGRLLPQTWDDVNDQYPKLFDPSKYIDHYDEYLKNCEDANYSENHYREEWVRCTTSRFLIGPDNMVYPCHRHLYAGDPRYACGTILDPDIGRFKYKWNGLLGRWVVHCDTKCNPCDFMVVKIKPTGEPTQVVPGLPSFGVAPAGVATTQASPK